jgi:hypothetical protein
MVPKAKMSDRKKDNEITYGGRRLWSSIRGGCLNSLNLLSGSSSRFRSRHYCKSTRDVLDRKGKWSDMRVEKTGRGEGGN